MVREEECDASPFCPRLLPSIHSCSAFQSKTPGEEDDLIGPLRVVDQN